MEKKIKSIDTGKDVKFTIKTLTQPLKEEFNDAFSEAEYAKPVK